MSGDKEREQRDLELLLKSYHALEEEQRNPSTEPFEREPVGRRRPKDRRQADTAEEESPTEAADGEMVMYRGRPIRRGSLPAPGAGSSARKPASFRGAGGSKPRRRAGATGTGKKGVSVDRVKQALATLNEMYDEGLITKAEFDSKRRQLLDRL
ncbi:MAG: SHOCT domain-containing protein [Actinomycetota bacterium]